MQLSNKKYKIPNKKYKIPNKKYLIKTVSRIIVFIILLLQNELPR